MEILAEREKGTFIGYLIAGIFFIILGWVGFSPELLEVSERVAVCVIGAGIALFSIVDIILPTKAVVREDDYIYVYKLFSKKAINIVDIKNASCEEISPAGVFKYGRVNYYRRTKRDIRKLVITVKENDTIKHIKIDNIKNATEAAESIKSLVRKEQETDY